MSSKLERQVEKDYQNSPHIPSGELTREEIEEQDTSQTADISCYVSKHLFDPKWLNNTDFCIILGPRQAGKTRLSHWLQYNGLRHHNYATARLWTGSKHAHEYPQFADSFTAEGSDFELLEDVLNWKANLLDKVRKTLEDNQKVNRWDDENAIDEYINLYDLLWFDDVASSHELSRSPELSKCATKGRHLKFGLYISTQHIHAIQPDSRASANWAFVFNFTETINREGIMRDFMPSPGGNDTEIKRATWNALIMDQDDKENPCFAIRMTGRSPIEGDKCRIYRVPPESKRLWKPKYIMEPLLKYVGPKKMEKSRKISNKARELLFTDDMAPTKKDFSHDKSKGELKEE